MKRFWITTFAIFCILLGSLSQASAKDIVLKDPTNDDNGPGTYTYPTHQSYRKGDFDLIEVRITERGNNIEFHVYMRNRIGDVWNSKSWGGNGFSVQFVQIYIHTGQKPGWRDALPGINIQFKEDWNKVVLLSPQGRTRLQSEINLKAKNFKSGIIIPSSTRAQGRAIIGIVPKSELGGTLNTKWGFQVIVQSNEGFPHKDDLLTRRINEYNGEHRFGGGDDGMCDPHVLDMLAGKAKGDTAEIKLQHDILKQYKCGDKPKLAVVPFVYVQ
jgi:hypothetical protein